jgi:hypothetical protein
MSEPISQFPESQEPELTKAQALIDFAFNYELPLNEEEATRATRDMLLAIADVQASAPNEQWEQERNESTGHIHTSREVIFDDGSILDVSIYMLGSPASDVQKGSYDDAEITLWAAVPYAEGVTTSNAHKISKVAYRLGHDEDAAIAEPQKNEGHMQLKDAEANKRIKDAGFDYNTDDEAVLSAMQEELIAKLHGTDPSLNPELEKLRAENEGFRHFSDKIRQHNADKESEKHSGMSHEMGLHEASKLANLLRTL